jgi:hypothetical protein
MLFHAGVSATDLKLQTLFVLERHDIVRRRAICERWTHPYGWQLRLIVNEQLARFSLCYSDAECTATVEVWRADLLKNGWVDCRRY